MKIQSIHIDKYKVFEDFDIDFRNEKGEIQNLIVIAGVNGCGKTTLLKEIISGVTLNRPKGTISFTDEIPVTMDGQPDFVDAGYKETLESFHSYIKENYNSLKFYSLEKDYTYDAEQYIVKFIDHLIYNENFRSFDSYDKVRELMNSIFDGFQLQIRFDSLNEEKAVFFVNDSGQKFSINDLSSGEKQIINKLFSLYIGKHKNKTILIDEPEESLHPSWQYRIAPLYQKFADDNNCQIILATHSPQIISSVKVEQIRLLKNYNGKIQVINDFDGSLGWTVDRVLLEIQGVGNRSPEIEKELDELSEMIHKNEYESSDFQDRFNKMETLLGSSDRNIILKKLEILRKKDKK